MKKHSKRYKELLKSAVKEKIPLKDIIDLVKKILQPNLTSQLMYL